MGFEARVGGAGRGPGRPGLACLLLLVSAAGAVPPRAAAGAALAALRARLARLGASCSRRPACAALTLGELDLHGVGAKPDVASARRWFVVAAAAGSAAARYELGDMLARGVGGAPDAAAAAAWYRSAAIAGSARAAVKLGDLAAGAGQSRNLPSALGWYEVAASERDAEGAQRLGDLYAGGGGVATDLERSCEWYLVAAGLGGDAAIGKVAGLIARASQTAGGGGEGLIATVARVGSGEALFAIGRVFERGRRGVAVNGGLAFLFYRLAAARGYAPARAAAARLAALRLAASAGSGGPGRR